MLARFEVSQRTEKQASYTIGMEIMGSSAPPDTRARIGEKLISAGLITQEQLKEALTEQERTGSKIVATLIALGHIDQRTFLNFLSKQPGVASIDLAGYDIPYQLRELIPSEFARKHEVVPMDKMGPLLTVGMACPLDVKIIAELESTTGMRVRAMLVAPEAIQSVLNKYYPAPSEDEWATIARAPVAPTSEAVLQQVSTALAFEGVMELVRAVSSLPAMSDTVLRVQAAVEDEEMGVHDVSLILRGDPSLSAKIIGLANSPANGVRHRIESIEGAATLLGMSEIYAVTVAAAVFDSFNTKTSYDYAALWRRSAVCASLAKILARTSGWKGTADIFAAGLLHDIGRAVFAEVAPALYSGIDHNVPDDSLIETEHEVFGIAHPEVGYIVSKKWGLPNALGESIRFHHRPELATASPELVGIIALAARLTDHLEWPEAVPLETCTEALETLGIESSQVISILDIARAMRDADPM